MFRAIFRLFHLFPIRIFAVLQNPQMSVRDFQLEKDNEEKRPENQKKDFILGIDMREAP